MNLHFALGIVQGEDPAAGHQACEERTIAVQWAAVSSASAAAISSSDAATRLTRLRSARTSPAAPHIAWVSAIQGFKARRVAHPTRF